MAIIPRTNKDGSISYGVRISMKIDGSSKPMWIGTFDRKKDAKDAEREALRNVKLYGLPKKMELISLGKLSEDFLAIKASKNISPATKRRYEYDVSHLVEWAGANMAVGNFNAHKADLFMVHMESKYAHSTAMGVRTTCRAMFDTAKRWGFISSNPFNGNAPSSNGNEPKRNRSLTQEEWLGILSDAPDYLVLTYAVWPLIGLRISEMRGLTKDRVDLVSKTIRVDRQINESSVTEFAPLKTKSSYRTVELCNLAADLLEAQMASHDGEFVFTGPNGGMLTHSLRVSLPLFMDSLGLDDVTSHTFRHTFGSWLIAGGAPLTYVQAMMGHKNLSETLDTYAHQLDDGTSYASLIDRVALQSQEGGIDVTESL